MFHTRLGDIDISLTDIIVEIHADMVFLYIFLLNPTFNSKCARLLLFYFVKKKLKHLDKDENICIVFFSFIMAT